MKKESYITLINDLSHKINNSNKIFRFPCTKNEIRDLENELSNGFPFYYKYFLEKIGVLQDLSWDLNQDKNDFIISEYSTVPNNMFMFGREGEDMMLLKSNDEEDFIYKYYIHTNELKKTDKTFYKYIERLTSNFENIENTNTDNSEKKIGVEISFNENIDLDSFFAHYDKDFEILGTKSFTTSADVTVEETEFKLSSFGGISEEMFHKSWDNSMYSIKFILLTHKNEIIEMKEIIDRLTMNNTKFKVRYAFH